MDGTTICSALIISDFQGKQLLFLFLPPFSAGCVAQSVGHLTYEPEVPGLISGSALLLLFLLLLIQEGQLSVTGENMCTNLIPVNSLGSVSLHRNGIVR